MSRWVNTFFTALLLTVFSVGAAAAASATATISDVAVSVKDADVRIEIGSDMPVGYSYYKVPNPLRGVIEIPRSQPVGVKPVTEVNEGAISRVLVEKKELPAFTTTQVTMELKTDAEVSIRPSRDGKRLTISFAGQEGAAAPAAQTPAVPKPPVAAAPAPPAPVAVVAPAPAVVPPAAPDSRQKMEPSRGQLAAPAAPPAGKPAARSANAPVVAPPTAKGGAAQAPAEKSAARRMVNNIRVNGSSVEIIGSGLDSYKSFTLADPPRLVVDIFNAGNGLRLKKAPMKVAAVRQCRVGEDAGNVRIVFDYVKGPVAGYRVEKTANGLRVTFPDTGRK